jgi:hypothetical protein
MLCVRYKEPTDGSASDQPSNHSWGTAIDFKLLGHDAPGNTGNVVPRFIAIMAPFFNSAGWYSGIGFHDTMHFEVANETIKKWKDTGVIGPVDPDDLLVASNGGAGGGGILSSIGGFFSGLFGGHA